MEKIKTHHRKVLECGFKIAYLLLVLSTFNAFLYDSPIQSLLVKISLIFGILALFGRVLFFRDYIKTPHWILLVLFCVSFLFSIFMNSSYGVFVADFKWLIWTSFLFFLLYVFDFSRSVKSYKKEFTVLSHIMILYGTVAASVGIYMLFALYQKRWFTGEEEQLMAGFWWGRLWGVYTDPNYGGVFTAIVVLLALYFIRSVRGWKKLLYVVAIIPNLFYMICSDSRTAELGFVVAVCFWIFYASIFKYGFGKKLVAALVVSVIFSTVFVGVGTFIKTECNAEVQKRIVTENAKKAGTTQQKKSTDANARKKDLKADVSSGRIGLWKSGMEVWLTSPVYGTGYNSFIPYAKENVSDTYAINNSQSEYMSLHNGYLNVLVYQGFFGAFILVAFMCLAFRRYQKGVRKIAVEDRDYVAILSSCVLVIGIAMVFLTEGIYTNSPGSFILWTFLGYLMHMFVCNDKVKIVS